jgi:hypothetical protein
MPKTPRKPQATGVKIVVPVGKQVYTGLAPRRDFLEAIPPEELRSAKVISEPITLTKLRRMVEKLEKPEGGYSVNATVCYDDEEEQWYVFSLAVGSDGLERRYLIYAIAGVGRITPFITKRHVPKGYRTLETLIRQINDIFGNETSLNVSFNLEKRLDLKNRAPYRNEES